MELTPLRQRIYAVCATVKKGVPHPEGECYSASFALGIKLAAVGIPTRLVKGECRGHLHWWLEMGGLVIDITADQFGDAPIVIEKDNPNYIVMDRRSPDFESIAIYLGIEIGETIEGR